MDEQLKKLYKTVILKHNSAPYHYEKKENATHQIDAYNPLCGDRFQLFIEIENGIIESIYFHGYGCAISKASTSVLAENLEGQTIDQAVALCEAFQSVVTPSIEKKQDIKEAFKAFAAAKDFPGRLQCATLSWTELSKLLDSF